MGIKFEPMTEPIVKGDNDAKTIQYGDYVERTLYPILKSYYENKGYIVVWKGNPLFKKTDNEGEYNNITLQSVISISKNDKQKVIENLGLIKLYQPFAGIDFEILYNPNNIQLNPSEDADVINANYQTLLKENMGNLDKPAIFFEIKTRKYYRGDNLKSADEIWNEYNTEGIGYSGFYLPSAKVALFKTLTELNIFPNAKIFFGNVDAKTGKAYVVNVPPNYNIILGVEVDTSKAKQKVSHSSSEKSRDVLFKYWGVLQTGSLESQFSNYLPKFPAFLTDTQVAEKEQRKAKMNEASEFLRNKQKTKAVNEMYAKLLAPKVLKEYRPRNITSEPRREELFKEAMERIPIEKRNKSNVDYNKIMKWYGSKIGS